ncbi:hypothetical protein ACN082_00800 [Rothia sp. CCM 9417]|uniref:hypothetical protein n=1 Tax=unclassified Rothia (in: high G+C Gram-positive bacteria) TaxID=2689056 RepID=UPI003AE6E31B
MQPSKTANSFQESFSLPLLGFILLAFIFPVTMVLYWPYPSQEALWVTYESAPGQITTLDTASLPLFVKVFAWVDHALPSLGASIFALQMARVSANFNVAAQFTQKSVRYFYQLRMMVLWWGIAYALVHNIIVLWSVENYYVGYGRITINGIWLNWPIFYAVVIFLIAGFMEGALSRSLKLQEDVDATI